MSRRLRVALLYGGRSAEHDVSRVTAVAVARALDPARYEIVPIAITTDGRWLVAEAARDALESGAEALPIVGDTATDLGSLVVDPGGQGPGPGIDVVLPLLHGPYGEDGTVQGLLELADVPYVGSGVVGSAVAMDKVMMKRAFVACGLPTAAHLVFRDGGDVDALVTRARDELGDTWFVKPANMGSSVGVSKVTSPDALADAVALALRFDEWVLVEEAITGREIEVGVLGDDPPEASVPGEVVPGDAFYSYADKYERDDARLLAPAPLTADEAAEARRIAVAAFEACRAEAMARVDLFLDPERGFLVNEVNTIPGFTPISMYPRLWQESGVPYPELLDRLIDLAFARHARRTERAGRQRFSQ